MSSINTSEDDMLALEMSYMELTNKFIDSGISPMASAAVMAKISFMIYKTSLNAEDYNSMIDTISDSRDLIKSFSEYVGVSRLN